MQEEGLETDNPEERSFHVWHDLGYYVGIRTPVFISAYLDLGYVLREIDPYESEEDTFDENLPA